MNNAPERIWAEPGMPGYLDEASEVYTVEYIRRDIVEDELTRLRDQVETLRGALNDVSE